MSKKQEWIVGLVLLAALVALVSWTAWANWERQQITIMMGNEVGLNAHGQGDHLYNFFGWGHVGTENGRLARRADRVASLMIPWAFRLGTPLDLTITMCGCDGAQQTRLLINGTTHEIALTNEWQDYTFTLPHTPTIYEQSLYLEWQSTDTPRPLLHQITVQAATPFYAAQNWFALVLLVSFGFIHTLRLPVTVITQRSALYWNGPLTLGISGMFIAASIWLYTPQLLPWSALVALGVLAFIALHLLVPEIGRRLMLFGCVLWLLAVPQFLGTWILDDAFISFRYAQNLLDGHGLIFNPGGERVEGYTNFLWTVILALCMAAGTEPVVTAQVLTSGLALTSLFLTYLIANQWWPGKLWALLPPVLLVLNPSFLLYTVRGSGMETALVTTLTLVAIWLLWRAQSWRGGLATGISCALLVMSRPDGALVPLAGGLLLLTAASLLAQRKWALPALTGLVVGFTLLYGPYYLWRFSYYGYPLPNTFYAKTGATVAQVQRGWAYTSEFFAGLGLRGLLLLLGLSLVGLGWALWCRRRDELRINTGPAPLLWLVLLLTISYVTLVGGDHFPLGRFFAPVVPLLMLLVAHGFATAWVLGEQLRERLPASLRLLQWAPGAATALVVLLFAWFNGAPLPTLDSRDPAGRIWGETQVALKNRELGLWFRQNTPPDTLVATAIAGAMPYYGERPVLDTLGLNDTHIAHLAVETMGQGIAGAEKTDLEYVLDQQPDYIPYATAAPYLELERFRTTYQLIEVRGPEGSALQLYQRQAPLTSSE